MNGYTYAWKSLFSCPRWLRGPSSQPITYSFELSKRVCGDWALSATNMQWKRTMSGDLSGAFGVWGRVENTFPSLETEGGPQFALTLPEAVSAQL